MTRVLRYPRLSAMLCVLAFACAAARDWCVSASLHGWAQVFLTATIALLTLCFVALSSRLFVDEQGVGVGFLIRTRYTSWEDLAAFGTLCCNGRRRYFYGMYQDSCDFLKMLHHAPQCGPWGFVVPAGDKLIHAVLRHCPFKVDLSPLPRAKREGRLRMQWQQAALYLLVLLPGAAIASVTGVLMLLYASQQTDFSAVSGWTLGAMGLFAAALMLISRVYNTIMTCPGFNEKGVCAGPGLYIPWEDVRFGYVHRVARMSGMFLLSQPLDVVTRRNAPPIICLSMPDTSTMLLAYLNYCPHADKGLRQ